MRAWLCGVGAMLGGRQLSVPQPQKLADVRNTPSSSHSCAGGVSADWTHGSAVKHSDRRERGDTPTGAASTGASSADMGENWLQMDLGLNCVQSAQGESGAVSRQRITAMSRSADIDAELAKLRVRG